MPRVARRKMPNAIYHIMSRSLSELELFNNNEDRDKYLQLIRKYKVKFGFKLYCYCLMGNHLHLMIDGNGADISKIMQGINSSYVRYYNKKYNRHGHLFQGRFKSKIITNEKYLKMLSLYIHNNPRDFKQYKNNPDKYRYSSLGNYIGKNKDLFGIIDKWFILDFFGSTKIKAQEIYHKIILKSEKNDYGEVNDIEDIESEYVSWRKPLIRNFSPNDLINNLCEKLNISKINLHIRYNRRFTKVKAVLILILKKFCNLADREICEIIGGITQARVSALCSYGIDILEEDIKIRGVVEDLIGLSN